MTKISMHDVVALKKDTKAQHFDSGNEILLPKGLVGTVVEEYAQGEAFEVEFANDDDAQTYAMLTVEADKLFLLHLNFVELAAAS